VTLAQLHTFLAVAETGSIRAAAARLVVTQSAVSASIAALQRSLDLRLVEPSGRGLRLTAAGAIYAGYLRRVLGLLDEARVAAGSEGEPVRGELRIAAVTTVGDHLLPGILVRFRHAHPQARIHVDVGNREQVLALLDNHEVDLVLGGRPAGDRNHVALAVRPNELIVVGPPDSPRLRTGDELLSWLAGQTWVLREPGSGTRATTESYLAGLDLAPPLLTLSSNAAVCESVAVGLGVTLISRDAVARDLAEGRLVELAAPGAPLERDWYLLAHRSGPPATARLLVDQLLANGEFERPPGARRRSRTPAEAVRD
jgi:LysR family transcriptional regulator, low CO2-responsive transcriptional regulator